MATFNLNRSEFEGLNSDILLPLLSFFKPKPPRIAEDDKGNSNYRGVSASIKRFRLKLYWLNDAKNPGDEV
jgi:hypothetical protein